MKEITREEKKEATNPIAEADKEFQQLQKKYENGDEMSMEDTLRYHCLLLQKNSVYGAGGTPAGEGAIKSFLNQFHDNGDGTININDRKVIAGTKSSAPNHFEPITADDLAKLNEAIEIN